MKHHLVFLSSLAIFLSVNSSTTEQSQAKPAKVFQPIINEITETIPSDLEMRLPTSIPAVNKNSIYASVAQSDRQINVSLGDLDLDFFTVTITNTPNCEQQENFLDCLVAVVGVAKDPIESQAQLDELVADNKDKIVQTELATGVSSFYFTEADWQSIIWRQDNMAHLLIAQECSDRCISQQELIDMAKSAVNEPAILSSDTSYYSF